MNVCIVGDGLVSLTLAKALVNQGIYVDIFSNQKINKIDKTRTIAISKANIEFFNNNVLNIKRILWKINKIEIYTDNLKNEKIFDFQNNRKELFSIIKNYELYNLLNSELKKDILFKRKKAISKSYNLIINCDLNSLFTKKYFFKKISKSYDSFAHTTIIDHKKIPYNDTAIQIFTKKGPMAFLPISNNKTSVVFSARGSKDLNFASLIKKYNFKYSILKINEISNINLKSLTLRNYYFKNILAFGDLLHKLHPLAGQGFNMSIRDMKLLLNLIQSRLINGLELDSTICEEFERKSKHKNYLFLNGIDFIYEFFNLESKINHPILSKSVQLIGKNKYVNNFFIKLADNGILI